MIGTDSGGPAGAITLAALRELANQGGAKRYVECRFGFKILSRALEAGLVAVDDTSPQRATVYLTPKGHALMVNK